MTARVKLIPLKLRKKKQRVAVSSEEEDGEKQIVPQATPPAVETRQAKSVVVIE